MRVLSGFGNGDWRSMAVGILRETNGAGVADGQPRACAGDGRTGNPSADVQCRQVVQGQRLYHRLRRAALAHVSVRPHCACYSRF